MDPAHVILAIGIGTLAGILGGLAGIGGSMVMIPGLALIFGFSGPERNEQHLYMAAAMAVNVLVAIPATSRHAKAGAVRRDLVVGIVPAMTVAIVAGVLVSNVLEGRWLKYGLAAFIAGYCALNIRRALQPRGEVAEPEDRVDRPRLVAVGGTAGFVGGLLGLGGGVVMVPMLQLLTRVRLRQAIAASSASMIVSATVGAALKLATLGQHGQSAWQAAILAIAMAPGAVLGADVGARLAHALNLRVVRLIISVLLLIAAARLVGVDAWALERLR